MARIPKDLSDKDMFQGYKEKESFETVFLQNDSVPVVRKPVKAAKENIQLACLTPELQEKIGKLLLELKVDLYKEGIVDYSIKVKKEGGKIILMPDTHSKK